MIDTHAHIYSSQYDNDQDEMIQRAKDQKIEKILLPNIDINSIEPMLALEDKHPNYCHSMMGMHPCYVDKNIKEHLAVMREWFDKRSFIAVGEIGLDLYWDESFFEQQKWAFREQVKWAKALNLPIAIHTRDAKNGSDFVVGSAFNEVMNILKEEQDGSLRGVFHCFIGSLEQAKQAEEIGFYIALGGVVTFKNSSLSEMVEGASLSHILLETDAPYLTPVPFRGKRNEPAYTYYVAEKIAQLKGISIEKVIEETTRNAKHLFSL